MKRIKLITVCKNNVLSSGYGTLTGDYRTGRITGHNKKAVFVLFVDEDGEFAEDYCIKTGRRLEDINDNSGWRINPSDWKIPDTKKQVTKKVPKKHRLERLKKVNCSTESVDGSTHNIFIELWLDNETGIEYAKTYREQHLEDDKSKTKQTPALVPVKTLINILK